MIVFPMAGLSNRFRNAGYEVPKYMLEAGGRSLLRHSVEGFDRLFASHPFMFVYRDIEGTDAFLRHEVQQMGIAHPVFVQLDAPTRGQAETVALGLQSRSVAAQEPLTIFNIDSIRPGFRMPTAPEFTSCDGWLEVFHGSGSNWSFVRPDAPQSTRVIEVTEKNPISELCCTGLYHFSRTADFMSAFRAERVSGPSQADEFYVAPLYNRLLAAGADVRYLLIEADEVIFAGVPAEYEEFKRKHG